MSTETMHEVTIDVVKQVYDNEQNRVVEETRTEIARGRFGGTSRVISVLKAYESVRTKAKDNLSMLEIGVDGNPFC